MQQVHSIQTLKFCWIKSKGFRFYSSLQRVCVSLDFV